MALCVVIVIIFSVSYAGCRWNFGGIVGSGLEIAGDMAQTSDGGYVAVGSSDDFPDHGWDCLMTKFAEDGAVEWIKGFSSDYNSWFTSVTELSDGTFIGTGKAEHTDTSAYAIFAARIFGNGSLSWEMTYIVDGAADQDGGGVGAVEISEETVLISGYLKDAGEWYKASFQKVRIEDGEILSSYVFGGVNGDYLQKTRSCSQGVISGGFDWQYLGISGIKAFVGVFDDNGEKIWTRVIGDDTLSNSFIDCIETRDEASFVCVGTTGSATVDRIIGVKLDGEDGDTVWAKTVVYTDTDVDEEVKFEATGVVELEDGDFLVYGRVGDIETEYSPVAVVLRMNSDFDTVVSQKYLGHSKYSDYVSDDDYYYSNIGGVQLSGDGEDVILSGYIEGPEYTYYMFLANYEDTDNCDFKDMEGGMFNISEWTDGVTNTVHASSSVSRDMTVVYYSYETDDTSMEVNWNCTFYVEDDADEDDDDDDDEFEFKSAGYN